MLRSAERRPIAAALTSGAPALDSMQRTRDLVTTTSELDALEARYLGEPSPRRGWAAFALGLAAPGLGWIYVGRWRTGVAINLLAVALWCGFVVAWATLRFYPLLPLSAFAAGWFVLVLMSAWDAARVARSQSDAYVLRDCNHWLVYASAALFAFYLPLVGLQQITMTTLWGVVPMHDDAMYPTLLPGDRLLVDRTAYRSTPPRRGDVVVFEDPRHDGRLRVARILGLPGESVVLADGIPFVDDAPFPRSRLGDDAVAELRDLTGAPRDDMQAWVEETRGRHDAVMYTIAEPSVAYWGEPSTWSLGEDRYFVLNDNRNDLDDSRSFGPIERADLVAMPVYVSYSVDDADDDALIDALPFVVRQLAVGVERLRAVDGYRSARTGRRVQPPAARR